MGQFDGSTVLAEENESDEPRNYIANDRHQDDHRGYQQPSSLPVPALTSGPRLHQPGDDAPQREEEDQEKYGEERLYGH